MMKFTHPVQVWSACPTPLTTGLTIDEASVARMVEAALAERIEGLFLGGTCGEGPWLPNSERERLVRVTKAHSAGRLKVAAQATDNSAPRVLDNIRRLAEAGADIAIMTPPPVFMNPTPERVGALFIETAAASPIPVGIYDLGDRRPVTLSEEWLSRALQAPNVVMLKDSSQSATRREIALQARVAKPELTLFNGDEFSFIPYLEAGYDGCMFGGAIAVAPMLHEVIALWRAGRADEAKAVDRRMQEILFGIYGGRDIACWLTGLKHHLVSRGMFSSSASFLQYPLTEECRQFGEAFARERLGGPAVPVKIR